MQPDSAAYDWSTFSIAFYYAAPLAQVYRAWATSAGLERFFVREAAFFRDERRLGPDELVGVGDRYHWRFVHGLELPGTVLACEADEHIAFTFGSMRVEVTFTPAVDATLVCLRQSDISTTGDGMVTSHLNCRSCWTFFMTNLQAILLGGTDVRDLAQPERASSMEVGFLPAELRST